MNTSAMCRLCAKMQRLDLEREQWKAGASIVEFTAEGLRDEGLQRAFLNAAPIQEILENSTR